MTLSVSLIAIDVDAADIKALYRRCQALEKLGKLDMAFKDVQRCATLEPKNKTFLETLRRLGADIQAKVSIKENATWNRYTVNKKHTDMYSTVLNPHCYTYLRVQRYYNSFLY